MLRSLTGVVRKMTVLAPRRSSRLAAAASRTSSSASSQLEIIYVDDASTMESPKITKKLARKTSRKAKTTSASTATRLILVKKVAKEETETKVLFPLGTLSRSYESKKLTSGYTHVVGVDEAGRGPLAGPVVAAACFVPAHVEIEGIHDSKKLTELQREALYEQLTTHPEVQYAVHVNSAQRIDEINILQASLESMVKAVKALPSKADFVFVDGNRMPPTLTIDAETVIKGDSKVYSIAAASVIAKVTRDRIMVQYDQEYPQYGLKQHKGYPTQAHMAAIAKHGPCAIHRMTFAPLKPKEDKKKKAKKNDAKAASSSSSRKKAVK